MGCGLSKLSSASDEASSAPPMVQQAPVVVVHQPPPPPTLPVRAAQPPPPPERTSRDEKAAVRELLTTQYLSEVRNELRCDADAGSAGLGRLRREYWKLFYWEDFPEHSEYVEITDERGQKS